VKYMVETEPLAVEGGRPVRQTPFAPWPFFDPDAIEAAVAVLRSGRVNYWTGTEGRHFEEEFAASVGCRYAVALANGTVALELALAALGIGPGDEVIVPSRTFIATASCVVMRGARPVMADINADNQNLDVASVKPLLSARTRAIIAVHLAGWPCEMRPLQDLAAHHNLALIEDCAQAQGATYHQQAIGSLGTIAAFSFCQDKIMTTGGEGGMLTTNDTALFERAWAFKDHGKNRAKALHAAPTSGFRWLHDSFGTNWRMMEMQSAMGRVLLRTLPAQLERRRGHARRLTQAFAKLGCLRLPAPPPEIEHAYYKFYAFLKPARLRTGWTRDRVAAAIVAEGVPCFSGSCSEIYLERAFPDEWRPAPPLPVAKALGETSLMFLVHPTLTDVDIDDTIRAVEKVLHVAAC